jgi:hypothetical protein
MQKKIFLSMWSVEGRELGQREKLNLGGYAGILNPSQDVERENIAGGYMIPLQLTLVGLVKQDMNVYMRALVMDITTHSAIKGMLHILPNLHVL